MSLSQFLDTVVYARYSQIRMLRYLDGYPGHMSPAPCVGCFPLPQVNEPLLLKVLDQIEANPGTHFQGAWASITADTIETLGLQTTELGGLWSPELGRELRRPEIQRIGDQQSCGTAFCVAGWAVELTRSQDTHYYWTGYGTASRLVLPTGEMVPIIDQARKELGLTCPEADWMFTATRTRPELHAAAAALIEADQYRLGG